MRKVTHSRSSVKLSGIRRRGIILTGLVGLAVMIGLLSLWQNDGSRRIHVDQNTAGHVKTGESWEHALPTLASALNVARPGDEIWVAEGTYVAQRETRGSAYEIPAGTTVYGGFEGVEKELAERDWKAHPVTLVGDLELVNGSTAATVDGVKYDGEQGAVSLQNATPVLFAGPYTVTIEAFDITTESNQAVSIEAGTAGIAEVTKLTTRTGGVTEEVQIETVADDNFSLDGTYFVLGDTSTTTVAFWYDLYDLGTTMPAGAGMADRQVEITGDTTDPMADYTADTVAYHTALAINEDAAFSASWGGTGNMIFVTLEEMGNVTDPDVGTAGFDIKVTEQGVEPLDGTYFVLYDAAGSVAFWFDSGNTGTAAPAEALAADRHVEINTITEPATAQLVAVETANTINEDPGFSAWANGKDIHVTSATANLASNALPGTSGFSVEILTNGASATLQTDTTTWALSSVASGATVQASAPWTTGGLRFLRWEDGNGTILDQSRLVSVEVSGDMTLVAVYGSSDAIIYVDSSATGSETGNDWTNAYTSLSAALNDQDVADGAHEIWVASGVYIPTTEQTAGVEASRSFKLRERTAIYGGFSGIETVRSQRRPAEYPTILRGGGAPETTTIRTVSDTFSPLDGTYIVLFAPDWLGEWSVAFWFDTNGDELEPSFSAVAGVPSDKVRIELEPGASAEEVAEALTNAINGYLATGWWPVSYFGAYRRGRVVTAMAVENGNVTDTKLGAGAENPNFTTNTVDGRQNPYATETYHVVVGADNAVIDGFTIAGGRAYGDGFPDNRGAGLANYVASPRVANCVFFDNEASEFGAGMYNFISSPTVVDCIFGLANGQANFASNWGGAMYNESNSMPLVTGCDFVSNSAGFGGAIYNYRSAPIVRNSTFKYNDSYRGGAIYNYATTDSNGATPVISNCLFEGNYVEHWVLLDGSYLYGEGGAIANRFSAPEIRSCQFVENETTRFGGAIANFDESPALITDSEFRLNLAEVQGAGVYNSSSNPSFLRCGFSNNTAPYGSGMYNEESSGSLDNCNFTDNLTIEGEIWKDTDGDGIVDTIDRYFGGYGAAFYIDGGEPILTNCDFADNLSLHTAGAVYIGAGRESGDTSQNNEDAGSNPASAPVMSNCDFVSNLTIEEGGAVWIDANGSPEFSSCTFGGSTAAYGNLAGPQDTTLGLARTEKETYRYDVAGNSYEKLTDFPYSIRNPGVVAVGGTVYVIGGVVTTTTAEVSAEMWKLEGGEWVQLASMNQARSHMGTTTVANKIYVFGGYTDIDSIPTDSYEVYDIQAGTWTTLGTMPETWANHSATSIIYNGNDYIYLAGGTRNKFRRYNIDAEDNIALEADQWYEVPYNSPLQGPIGLNSVFNDGTTAVSQVWAYGGNQSFYFDLDSPDPINGWRPGPEMLDTRRQVFASGYANVRLVSIGGVQGTELQKNAEALNRGEASFPPGDEADPQDDGTAWISKEPYPGDAWRDFGSAGDNDKFIYIVGGFGDDPGGRGGAVFNNGGSPSFRTCMFYNNSAGPASGDGDGQGGAVFTTGGAPQFEDSSFSENVAFVSGEAMASGGAVHCESDTSFEDCTFDANYCWTPFDGFSTKDEKHNSPCYGGALYISATNVTLTGSVLTRNSVLLGYAAQRTGTDSKGGAVYVAGGGEGIVISGSTFGGAGLENLAEYGGGIYLQDGSVTVSACSFAGNAAERPLAYDDEISYWFEAKGGAIYNESGSPSVMDSTFTSNYATHRGAGVYNGGDPETGMFSNAIEGGAGGTFERCDFTSNSLTGQSGMYSLYMSGAGMHNWFSSVSITQCVFQDHNAEAGAAVANYDASPTMDRCVFLDNTALGPGGALANMRYYSGSSPTLTSCYLGGNTAGYEGGGMYSDGSPTLTNCVFWDNSGTSGGGVATIASVTTLLTVNNCTFNANYAANAGGGIFQDNSDLLMTNSIAWGNIAGFGDGKLDNLNEVITDNSELTFTYSCIKGGREGPAGFENTNIGADPVNDDPLFVNAGVGNLRLQADSPCIDTANPADSAAQDIDANDRDENPDMGAYESIGDVPEMLVEANSREIVSGDTTPNVSDLTDFGYVSPFGGTPVAHVFTIKNIGVQDLVLNGTPRVQVIGPSAADFQIATTDQPVSPIISGNETTVRVVYDPWPGGSDVRSAMISIPSNDSDEDPYTFYVQGLAGIGEPDIEVKGVDGSVILDGDADPNLLDGTDFGSVSVNDGLKTMTYTIRNTGGSDLTVSGVALTGSAASDFYVSSNPTSVLVPGDATTFKVTFDPSETGTRAAFIEISSDDPDEDPYTFKIQGTGIGPRIKVFGNGREIPNREVEAQSPSELDDTDYGTILTFAPEEVTRTFTIINKGTVNLNLIGNPRVSVLQGSSTGTVSPHFEVLQQPADTLPPEWATDIDIKFSPESAGTYIGYVVIFTDDVKFSFAIQGTVSGNVPPVAIATVDNAESAVLELNEIGQLSASQAYDPDNQPGSMSYLWEVLDKPAAGNAQITPVAALTEGGADVDHLQPTFSANVPGVYDLQLTVRDDWDGAVSTGAGASDTDTVRILVGDALAVSLPDSLAEGAGVVSGAGKVTVSAASIVPVTVTLSSSDTTEVEVPATVIINAGDTSATFDITMIDDVLTDGDQTVTISANASGFASHDEDMVSLDDEVQNIELTGNGVVIENGDEFPSLSDHTDFGPVVSEGATTSRTFTINNLGHGDLLLTGLPPVQLTGPNASDFTVTDSPTSPISGMNATSFRIRFQPPAGSVPGVRTAIVQIASNDPDDALYEYTIRATKSEAPEMRVLGNDIEIVDGSQVPSELDGTDFGASDINGADTVRTFTIENTGTGDLKITDIKLTGSSEFSIDVAPGSPVAPSGSTTFDVRFSADSTGIRTATVIIANNDNDEDPYDFVIQATGVQSSGMDVIGNGVSIANGDTSPSQNDHTDFGSATVNSETVTRTFTIENNGTATLNLTDTNGVVISGSESGDFTLVKTPTLAIEANGSTTFQIRFAPSAEGQRQAVVEIPIDDATIDNLYTFNIEGEGIVEVTGDDDDDGTGGGTGDDTVIVDNGGSGGGCSVALTGAPAGSWYLPILLGLSLLGSVKLWLRRQI